MTGITEEALGMLLREIQDTTPENFQRHLRAEAFRVIPPPGKTPEPSVSQPPIDTLQAAKLLLERNGYTVVRSNRIGVVEASRRFSYIELAYLKDLDGIVESVMGSLAGQIGIELHDAGALTKHDKVGTMDRTIGWTAAVILPEKTK
jgi:hypothetical protein